MKSLEIIQIWKEFIAMCQLGVCYKLKQQKYWMSR